MLLQACKKEVTEPEIITLTEDEVSFDAEKIRIREQSPSAMQAMGELLTRNHIRDLYIPIT